MLQCPRTVINWSKKPDGGVRGKKDKSYFNNAMWKIRVSQSTGQSIGRRKINTQMTSLDQHQHVTLGFVFLVLLIWDVSSLQKKRKPHFLKSLFFCQHRPFFKNFCSLWAFYIFKLNYLISGELHTAFIYSEMQKKYYTLHKHFYKD